MSLPPAHACARLDTEWWKKSFYNSESNPSCCTDGSDPVSSPLATPAAMLHATADILSDFRHDGRNHRGDMGRETLPPNNNKRQLRERTSPLRWNPHSGYDTSASSTVLKRPRTLLGGTTVVSWVPPTPPLPDAAGDPKDVSEVPSLPPPVSVPPIAVAAPMPVASNPPVQATPLPDASSPATEGPEKTSNDAADATASHPADADDYVVEPSWAPNDPRRIRCEWRLVWQPCPDGPWVPLVQDAVKNECRLSDGGSSSGGTGSEGGKDKGIARLVIGDAVPFAVEISFERISHGRRQQTASHQAMSIQSCDPAPEDRQEKRRLPSLVLRLDGDPCGESERQWCREHADSQGRITTEFIWEMALVQRVYANNSAEAAAATVAGGSFSVGDEENVDLSVADYRCPMEGCMCASSNRWPLEWSGPPVFADDFQQWLRIPFRCNEVSSHRGANPDSTRTFHFLDFHGLFWLRAQWFTWKSLDDGPTAHPSTPGGHPLGNSPDDNSPSADAAAAAAMYTLWSPGPVISMEKFGAKYRPALSLMGAAHLVGRRPRWNGVAATAAFTEQDQDSEPKSSSPVSLEQPSAAHDTEDGNEDDEEGDRDGGSESSMSSSSEPLGKAAARKTKKDQQTMSAPKRGGGTKLGAAWVASTTTTTTTAANVAFAADSEVPESDGLLSRIQLRAFLMYYRPRESSRGWCTARILTAPTTTTDSGPSPFDRFSFGPRQDSAMLSFHFVLTPAPKSDAGTGFFRSLVPPPVPLHVAAWASGGNVGDVVLRFVYSEPRGNSLGGGGDGGGNGGTTATALEWKYARPCRLRIVRRRREDEAAAWESAGVDVSQCFLEDESTFVVPLVCLLRDAHASPWTYRATLEPYVPDAALSCRHRPAVPLCTLFVPLASAGGTPTDGKWTAPWPTKYDGKSTSSKSSNNGPWLGYQPSLDAALRLGSLPTTAAGRGCRTASSAPAPSGALRNTEATPAVANLAQMAEQVFRQWNVPFRTDGDSSADCIRAERDVLAAMVRYLQLRSQTREGR